MPSCELCGHPMPAGEEMFKYHGYSGACPEPPVEAEARQRGLTDLSPEGRNLAPADQSLTVAEARAQLVARVYEGWELGKADLEPLIEAVRREERERYSDLVKAAGDLVDLTERWNNTNWDNEAEYAEQERRAYRILIDALDVLDRLGGPQPAQGPSA